MRRPLTCAVGSLLALLPFAGHTQDCPTAQTARRGFVVERGDQQKTEVAIGEGDVVHTTMRYAGRTQLETDLFAGLFSLSRLDRGRRSTYRPLTDLRTLFPLRVGQKALALFDYTSGDKTVPMTLLLLVKRRSHSPSVNAPTGCSRSSITRRAAKAARHAMSSPTIIRPISSSF